ncbi:hypothetical protein DENSPDRAFT_632577 [Dentipellis sp. KUC8613]|nr:hypothetical protein DENSPDRAFT_632577 [Dentipellis sp. KUC8613]
MQWSGSHSLDGLPQYMIVFGIVFDADYLYIVAHFPQLSISRDRVDKYISTVVDKLPFRASLPGPTYVEAAVGRLRVAIALLVLRNHASRLVKLWEHQEGFWYKWIINVELMMRLVRTTVTVTVIAAWAVTRTRTRVMEVVKMAEVETVKKTCKKINRKDPEKQPIMESPISKRCPCSIYVGP